MTVSDAVFYADSKYVLGFTLSYVVLSQSSKKWLRAGKPGSFLTGVSSSAQITFFPAGVGGSVALFLYYYSL